ncbi:uncharacterized protein LOC122027922 isoform X1 [Zingiber officinale]|uniref:C3H1-type domain-containing protein n=1 Tax=Zingiber officinale TaxID=94328 RepID=A0A8J5ESK5_ZINOF|nr:uncharacterized protein LOC122027922 isoform X1 [Zingiber officinale]KAG6473195.1 hypothetical protein ZIOFF_067108 [Zingiber officinale]
MERSSPPESWMDSPSSIRRGRLSSPPPSAFLAPAFDACVAATPHSPSSGDSVDIDASLLRYTRSGKHLYPPDSFDLSSSTTRRLRGHLKLRPSLDSPPPASEVGGRSFISPLSPIDNLPPRRVTKYVTPVKVEVGEGMVVMDGVLVSDAGHGIGRSDIERDVCGALDENGICRNGSKCVFAHWKEKLHNAPDVKQNSELSARRFGWCSNHSLPSATDVFAAGEFTKNVASASPTTLLNTETNCSKLKICCLSPQRSIDLHLNLSKPALLTEGGTISDLPPLITDLTEAYNTKLVAPLASPMSLKSSFQLLLTEIEDAQITRVLYGLNQRSRLPVFTQFCIAHVEEEGSESNT